MFGIAVFTSCDSLETDSFPEPASSQTREFVTRPGGAISFDLGDLIQSGEEVNSTIAQEPAYGIIQSLGNNRFTYHPSGLSSTDQVVFESVFVLSGRQRSDTINFRVVELGSEGDTTGVVCGIIASGDFFEVPGEEPVMFDVLANDEICPELELDDQSLSILHGPSLGVAEVNGLQLVYSTNANAELNTVDTLAYTVCSKGNPQMCASALVFVYLGEIGNNCEYRVLENDVVTFAPVTGTNVMNINVFENDSICTFYPISSFEVTQPQNGEVHIVDGQNGIISYELLNTDFKGEEEFEYEVCFTDDSCNPPATVKVIVD